MRLALVVLCLLPAAARADSDSLFTLGVGTSLGLSRLESAGTPAQVSGELRVRARVLLGLGGEASYTPNPIEAGAPLVYDNILRLSGLLYVVPTSPVAGYLKLGIGAGTPQGLLSVSSRHACYHGGLGLEAHLGDHVVLGAEALVLVPGVSGLLDDGSPWDAVGLGNWRATLGVMYFL